MNYATKIKSIFSEYRSIIFKIYFLFLSATDLMRIRENGLFYFEKYHFNKLSDKLICANKSSWNPILKFSLISEWSSNRLKSSISDIGYWRYKAQYRCPPSDKGKEFLIKLEVHVDLCMMICRKSTKHCHL
jgi:hypothetical protein